MEDVIIRLAKIPTPGVTVLDEDGNYNIYIDDRLTFEERRKVADHEMNHIRMNHFFLNTPVAECEHEAGARRWRDNNDV